MDHCKNCGLPIKGTLDDFILAVIQRSLSSNDGNKQKAAKELGISRSTLYRYIDNPKGDKSEGKTSE